LAAIHTFFEYLAGEKPERIWPNPVVSRRHYLKMGQQLPRDVPDKDVERLLEVNSDERDRAMFGLRVGAGLRIGEVVTLRLDWVEAPIVAGQLTKLRLKGKGNKERVVWLTSSLWETLQAWLAIRPQVESDHIFLNHHRRPISVSGVQYRFKQHRRAAEISASCHRLRHTFARRLAENGMAVDSLAKLLGHQQLRTTQGYIDGADPSVRQDFAVAMSRLETKGFGHQQRDPQPSGPVPRPPKPAPATAPKKASPAELEKLLKRLKEDLPVWLGEGLEAYLSWHWPTWRARSAYRRGSDLLWLVRRLWGWLDTHRQVDGWHSFGRADLEAWLQARSEEKVSQATVGNNLAHLRSIFRFLEARDWPLDPGFFRIQAPKPQSQTLPRYLHEIDYRRLEKIVLLNTEADTYHAYFDRACILTLSHTGIRLSELLDLGLGDLNLEAGYATVRGGKPGRDRVVYLTPALIKALNRYLTKRPDLADNDDLFVLTKRSPCAHTIRHRLKLYGQKIKLKVTPHQLRHTLATRLINQGMPIHSLRKLLGHQHLNQTQLYAQIYDETLYQQFSQAMAHLEAIEVENWPGLEVSRPAA
jgi:site-specific recombinase XerD